MVRILFLFQFQDMMMNGNDEMNKSQALIASFLKGGLLILAPVGTGKTLTLAERAAKAIASGIAPNRILCLTFTNRAAKEMAVRIGRIHPKDADKIIVSTFHSLCSDMLRQEAREIGIPSDYVVYDDVDSIELISELGRMEFIEARQLYYSIESTKANATGNQITAAGLLGDLFEEFPSYLAGTAIEYQKNLLLRHALDFQDLVAFTRAMLKENEDARERWMNRFDFIQVDEVQDTHYSEYLIVRALAKRSGNLALIGDFDQTIYEWRGSQPEKVIEAFKRDFAPVAVLSLSENYRSTRTLLNAAMSFAKSFDSGSPACKSNKGVKRGSPVKVFIEQDEAAEAGRIGQLISELYQENTNLQFNRIGVLTRTNNRGSTISQVLSRMSIPHVTVEQYEFFRRQEVKDALAHLKILVNPHDLSSLLRVITRPSKGIGEVTIQEILKEGSPIGLRLPDMLDKKTMQYGEPFGALLEAFETGSIVVFDVETTGLDFGRDEVIEIAGVKLNRGRPSDEFHAYLRSATLVGESKSIHSYDDRFLDEHGEDPKTVFKRFFDWCGESIQVGHNVAFDLGMLEFHSSRLDLDFPMLPHFDTYDIAQRFLDLKQNRLADLAEHLNVGSLPAHQALDDARCTADVLAALVPLLRRDSRLRRSLVKKHGKAFYPLAEKVERWKAVASTARPSELLAYVLSDSGLEAFYKDKPARMENLDQLKQVFAVRDDESLHPRAALHEVIKFAALAKNIDFLSDTDNRVPVITVHQAKGLEFDTVFIAGAVEGEFPIYLAVRDGKLKEEMRVFYVAMTRARQQLYITGFRRNGRGFSTGPSRFISMMGRENVVHEQNMPNIR